MSTAAASIVKAKVARFERHGNPSDVVRLEDEQLLWKESADDNKIMVELLGAPINPADINMIEGVYKQLPQLPAIGGNEGVFRVIRTGSNIKDLKVNDWVIPRQPLLGTWRSHAIWDAKNVVSKSVVLGCREFLLLVSVRFALPTHFCDIANANRWVE
jgi:trans-2-enoyl-CoA reductase